MFRSGGIRDANDDSYVDCALREAEEEIGLDRCNIDVWGEGQLVRPMRGPAIMPVVGYVNNFQSKNLHLNANEVDKVFTIPLRCLSSNDCKQHTQFRPRTGHGFSLPMFTCGERRVWGISAVITHIFLCALLPKENYSNIIPFVKSYRPIST